MFDTKLISIILLVLFLSMGCEESPTSVEVATANPNTLSNPNHGNGIGWGRIEDYFYNLEEGIEAKFLFYNAYQTRGVNTISSPSILNPYLDTLNFRTFPYYTVPIENREDTISYVLSLTPENIGNYSTLFPLDETNTDALNWCDSMLVTYAGDCPPQVEVDFDYQLSATGTGARVDDTQSSPATFTDLISKKEVTFSESWTNIKSLVWDNDLNRYDMVFEGSDSTKSVHLCAGICDSTKIDTALPPCTKTLTTSCYDSTYVIRNIKDEFDSLIYVGIIDTTLNPVNDLMMVDRNEWVRKDTIYKSSIKPYVLDTTFTYQQIKIPDDSPMFRVNGDCNQNLQWDGAETYYDWGTDWCPDSLETGEGPCIVVDTDSDNDLFDEVACNCYTTLSPAYKPGFCSIDIDGNGKYDLGEPLQESMATSATCTADPNQCSDSTSTSDEACEGVWTGNIWTPPNDPNSDNWGDCGWDGYCPGHPNDTNGNENGTEKNGVWDTFERFELNGQYDFNTSTKTGEYFIDKNNGVPNEPAEFCVTGNDCKIGDLFEDRNCNGKWDKQESGDKGNGIWDDNEAFIDTSGNGQWEVGEPLYKIGDRLATLIVDYTNPLNPVQKTILDTTTSVTLYYGTINNPVYITYDKFVEIQQVIKPKSEKFHDIYSKKTTYTNTIIEEQVPGNSDDYDIIKLRWFKFDNSGSPFYGHKYHIFKTAENGDIIKMEHPLYYYYYGYYWNFDELESNSWRTDSLYAETFIYTHDGYLRPDEYYYTDETIVTDVADYYVEKLYEVTLDDVVVPYKKVTYKVVGPGDTTCLNIPTWPSSPYVDIEDYFESDGHLKSPFNSNYRQNCPPVDTLLTSTFKITNTKTITMIGTGLELGIRNTVWLGTEGANKPIGIVQDKMEIRWGEPYWDLHDGSWETSSIYKLSSLRKTEPENSNLLRIFQPIKRISLNQLINEDEFNNDPYVINPSYGMHQLSVPNEK